jgi:hypothetical protein
MKELKKSLKEQLENYKTLYYNESNMRKIYQDNDAFLRGRINELTSENYKLKKVVDDLKAAFGGLIKL